MTAEPAVTANPNQAPATGATPPETGVTPTPETPNPTTEKLK